MYIWYRACIICGLRIDWEVGGTFGIAVENLWGSQSLNFLQSEVEVRGKKLAAKWAISNWVVLAYTNKVNAQNVFIRDYWRAVLEWFEGAWLTMSGLESLIFDKQS
jgi:hypothetical protein